MAELGEMKIKIDIQPLELWLKRAERWYAKTARLLKKTKQQTRKGTRTCRSKQ